MTPKFREYIRTDGSQYFLTPITLSADTKVVMTVRKAKQTVTSDAYYIWLGQETTTDTWGGTTGRNIGIRNNNAVGATSIHVQFSGNSNQYTTTWNGLNTVNGTWHTLSICAGSASYDTNTVTPTYNPIQNTSRIMILAGYPPNSGKPGGNRHIAADINQIVISKNDIEVANYFAATDTKGDPCLYDKVSCTFLYPTWEGGFDQSGHPLSFDGDNGDILDIRDMSLDSDLTWLYSAPSTNEITVDYKSPDGEGVWTVSGPDWVSFNRSSGGDGATVVEMTTDENDTNAKRTGTITVTDGIITRTITFDQWNAIVFHDYMEATSTTSQQCFDLTGKLAGVAKVKVDYMYAPLVQGSMSSSNYYAIATFGYPMRTRFYSSTPGAFEVNGNQIGDKSLGDDITLQNLVFTSSGLTTDGMHLLTVSAITGDNAYLLGKRPIIGERLGTVEFYDSNDTLVHKYRPAVINGTSGYFDCVNGAFVTPYTTGMQAGDFTDGFRTYRLDATVSESANITLDRVQIKRIEDGQVKMTITPTNGGGTYQSRSYTGYDSTDNPDAQWRWEAEDIYGSSGNDTVSLTVDGGVDHFWIQNDGASDLVMSFSSGTFALQYSADGENWTVGTPTIPANTKMYITQYPMARRDKVDGTFTFTGNQPHRVGGSLSALLYAYNPQRTSTAATSAFANMLLEDTTLTHANLLTVGQLHTSTNYMFQSTFQGCFALVAPPDFSGIYYIADNALDHTFASCSSLTEGVYLGNASYAGYRGMYNMYNSCSSLRKAWTPALEVYDNSDDKWTNWLVGVAQTGQLVRTSRVNGIPASSPNGIPNNWSIVIPHYATLETPTLHENGLSDKSFYVKWNIVLSGGVGTVSDLKLNVREDAINGETKQFSLPPQTSGTTAVKGLNASTTYYVTLTFRSGVNSYSSPPERVSTTSYAGFYLVNTSSSNGTLTMTNNSSSENSLRVIIDSVTTDYTMAAGASDSCTVPAGKAVSLISLGGWYTLGMDVDHIVYGSPHVISTHISGSTMGTASAIFRNDTHLTDAFGCEMLGDANDYITDIPDHCLEEAFAGCTALKRGMDLTSVTSIGEEALNSLYAGCSNLEEVWAPSPESWDSAKTDNWMYNVPVTGTLHANRDLAIPTGANGIPAGWTRLNN